MVQTFTTLRGYNRVRNDLRWLAAQYPDEIEDIVADFAKSERAKLKSTPYPPERPEQTYIRTGRLANSWRAEREASARWVIRNSAPYARWVVGKDTQVWFHKGRWWIAEEVVAEDTPELTRRLTQRLEERFE